MLNVQESTQESLDRHITAFGASLQSARDQTSAQARSLVLLYMEEGLLPGAVPPGMAQSKLQITNHIIAGVQFLTVESFDTDGRITKTTPSPIAPHPGLGLDFAFVVFMVRLTRMLQRKWSVNTIYHLGFITAAKDAHNKGRAFDFVGARGKHGGADFDINVFRHWKRQPVTMPEDWGKLKKGDKVADWPSTFHNTNYRLDPKNNPNLDASLVGGATELDTAFKLFQQVYDLAAQQGQDTDTNQGNPTSIGKDSSFIIHPDYKKVSDGNLRNGRDAHFQHIHMQVGFR